MSSDTNSKKNAKKKQKKKAAEESSSVETQALEQAIKDYNPNAELIVDGWVEVKDPKKAKSKERLIKKKAAAEAKAADASAETDHAAATIAAPAESPKASKKKRKSEEPQAAKKKGPEQTSKKKKNGKAADVKRPTNEAELVALIKQIIDGHPSRFLNVANIGDRITALTKCPWNKTFKPEFGNLKDFIADHADDFHFDETLDRAFVKNEWDQMEALKAKQQAELNAKKAAKNRKSDASSSSSEHKPKSKKSSSNGAQADVSPVSVVLKIVAILGLAAALVFLTALAVNGFDANMLMTKARALLG